MNTRNANMLVMCAVTAAVTVLAAVSWVSSSDQLEFVELERPEGFRALLLEGGSSTADPLSGILDGIAVPAGPDASEPQTFDLCDALMRDERSPAAGPRDAAVTVIEFTDYRCPYCRTLTGILSELREETGIRLVYKEWPILGEPSRLAARAALAADGQGLYVELHEKLMASRLTPTDAYIGDVAAALGLDVERLRADMSDDRIADALRDNARLAARLGLSGTPALVVGRTIVQGAVTKSQLQSLIAAESTADRVCQSTLAPPE